MYKKEMRRAAALLAVCWLGLLFRAAAETPAEKLERLRAEQQAIEQQIEQNQTDAARAGDLVNLYTAKEQNVKAQIAVLQLKIQECEEAGYSFEKVIETVEAYIADQHTFFVLDNLETLRKNGRLSKVKALVASALKIKPVMGSTDEGAICQLDQARGMNKALVKMAQNIVDKTKDSENKILAISHCNCRERAVLLKNALEERMPVKHIVILDTAGVSSMYANDGGVIVAV